MCPAEGQLACSRCDDIACRYRLSIAGWRLYAFNLHPHTKERRPAGDEKRLPVFSPEHHLQRPLGNFDGVDLLAGPGVHIDLARRQINIAGRVHRDSLAALLEERLEVREIAI